MLTDQFFNSFFQSQIYLIGNIFLWYLSLFAVFTYCCLFVFYLMRKRRRFEDLSEGKIGKLNLENNFCSLSLCFSSF